MQTHTGAKPAARKLMKIAGKGYVNKVSIFLPGKDLSQGILRPVTHLLLLL